MRKLRNEVKQKEERILFLSGKVEKNKMADADVGAELQGLQAGEERRGSNASQTGDSCFGGLMAAGCCRVCCSGTKPDRRQGQCCHPRVEQFRSRCLDQAHKGIATEAHQDLQDGTPWMKERMTIWKDWCLKQKKKEKQPGKGPKTF